MQEELCQPTSPGEAILPSPEGKNDSRSLRFAGILFLICALFTNAGVYRITDPLLLPCFTQGALGWIAAGGLFLCISRVFRNLDSLPKAMQVSWGILLLLFLIHLFSGKGLSWNYLHLPGEELTLLALPLLFCCCFEVCKKHWIRFGAFLWGFNLLMVVLARFQGKALWRNGICGNENWSAALLAMGSVFMYLVFENRLRTEKNRQFLLWGLLVLSTGMNILIGSKGAILCTILCVGLFLFLQGKKPMRTLLTVTALLLILTGGVFARLHTEKLQKFLTDDARPALYQGACSLIQANWITGTGTGGLENELMKHRPLEYFFVHDPASRSNHPHNHFLFVAGCQGIGGFLCWLILLGVPLFKTARKLYLHQGCSPAETACFFLLIYALLHGSLDLIMEVWPTWILALTALGGLWHFNQKEQSFPHLAEETTKGILHPTVRILCPVIMGICFFCGGNIAWYALYAQKQLYQLQKGSMGRSEALSLIRETAQKCPGNYQVNFSFMTLLERKFRDPQTTLFVSSLMLQGNTPNYPGVHAGRGNALMALGRFREAWEHYKQDAVLFPMTLRPVYNMVVASRAMRDFTLAKQCEQILLERMKIRKLTVQDLQKILKGKGILDLRAGYKP